MLGDESHHKRAAELVVFLPAQRDHFLGFGNRHTEGLFAKDMLTGLGARPNLFGMDVCGCGDIDGVTIRFKQRAYIYRFFSVMLIPKLSSMMNDVSKSGFLVMASRKRGSGVGDTGGCMSEPRIRPPGRTSGSSLAM